MGSTIVYYLISFPLFVPGYFTPTGESDVEVMNNILLISVSSVFSGIVFAAAFLSVARTLQKGGALRGYMIIAHMVFFFFMLRERGGFSACFILHLDWLRSHSQDLHAI